MVKGEFTVILIKGDRFVVRICVLKCAFRRSHYERVELKLYRTLSYGVVLRSNLWCRNSHVGAVLHLLIWFLNVCLVLIHNYFWLNFCRVCFYFVKRVLLCCARIRTYISSCASSYINCFGLCGAIRYKATRMNHERNDIYYRYKVTFCTLHIFINYAFFILMIEL